VWLQLCRSHLHDPGFTRILCAVKVTTAMLAAMRCFLHILQHSTDRQGRPVNACTNQNKLQDAELRDPLACGQLISSVCQLNGSNTSASQGMLHAGDLCQD
jgi:hypothetical protein